MQAATCPREDNKRSHRINQRSISRARTATRNSLLLVPSTDTPKWLILNNGAHKVEDKAVQQDNDPPYVNQRGHTWVSYRTSVLPHVKRKTPKSAIAYSSYLSAE